MDFGQRISDATSTKDTSYGTYNKYAGEADSAKGAYDTSFDTRQNYGDIYDTARDKYMNTDEINAAKGANTAARDAINQVTTTLNKLPESIRQQYGGTGLTEAQRQRAMQDQSANMANTYNYANTNFANTSADYQALLNQALSETQNVAGGNYQSQEDALNALQNNWATLLNQRNTAYGQYQTDQSALANVFGARDAYTQNEEQMALTRWQEEQANARAAADRANQFNLQKYLTDQQTAAATAQSTLQQQLLDKQNRAAYNTYVKDSNSTINDQFQKDNGNLWNYFWSPMAESVFGAKNYGDSLVDKNTKARNNIMTYDQYVGNI